MLLVASKAMTAQKKLNIIKHSALFKRINKQNIHVSKKSRMLKECFEVSLIECKELFKLVGL